MPRVPEHVTDLSNQALVQIDVSDGAIHYFPTRRGSTVIFRWGDRRHPPLALPLEVRWLVTGLGPHQFLWLDPKDRRSAAMFGPPARLVLTRGRNSVTSGFPSGRYVRRRVRIYSYSITLRQGRLGHTRVLARLDPDVVIKDSP